MFTSVTDLQNLAHRDCGVGVVRTLIAGAPCRIPPMFTTPFASRLRVNTAYAAVDASDGHKLQFNERPRN